MLVDTDILIDYLRGRADAVTFLEQNIDQAYISAISVAELYQGVRNGRERVALDHLVSALNVLDLDSRVAVEGGLYRRTYRNSHGCGLADCLIAATASTAGMPLASLNVKHYPMLKHVVSPYDKP